MSLVEDAAGDPRRYDSGEISQAVLEAGPFTGGVGTGKSLRKCPVIR